MPDIWSAGNGYLRINTRGLGGTLSPTGGGGGGSNFRLVSAVDTMSINAAGDRLVYG